MNDKEELLMQISEVATAFYQNRNADAMKKMPMLAKMMTAVLDTADERAKEKGCIVLKSLLEAYEQKEYVMVADILSYEVIDLIDK